MRGIKRSNRTSINLNDSAIICLQRLNYLDGKKKSIGNKSLSDFVSKLILEFTDLNHPDWKRHIREKILVSELYDQSAKRDKLEHNMKRLGSEIAAIREMKNVEDDLSKK